MPLPRQSFSVRDSATDSESPKTAMQVAAVLWDDPVHLSQGLYLTDVRHRLFRSSFLILLSAANRWRLGCAENRTLVCRGKFDGNLSDKKNPFPTLYCGRIDEGAVFTIRHASPARVLLRRLRANCASSSMGHFAYMHVQRSSEVYAPFGKI